MIRSSLKAVFIALSVFSVAVQAQTIVNDSFADGISNNGPGQIGLFTTASSNALDLDQAGGPVDFATGTSGRAIHGTFAPQQLSNAGDRLDVSIAFTTPATVAPNNNEVLRFALFDTSFTPGGQAAFNENINASSSSPNPVLNALPGFSAELDDINAQANANVGTSDLIFRTHNVTQDLSLADAPSGRGLTTTSGFDNIGSGEDDQFLLDPSTDYSATVSVAREAGGDFEVGIEFFDAAGTSIGSHFDTALATTGAEVGLNTDTFDLLGISASSGAFGSTSSLGEPDNGIDIRNITITRSVVPEPGSGMLLLLALGSLGFIRQRK